MKNTAGEAKRRGRKAPMSVPFFLESKAKDWQYKKGRPKSPQEFLFNAQEHLDKCLYLLNSDSPFKHFERNNQITSDLINVISDISKRLSSGQFKII